MQPVKTRRGIRLAIIAMMMLGILAGAYVLWFRRDNGEWKPMSKPPISKTKPVSMTFSLWDKALSTTTNSAGISEVLKRLRAGRAAEEHKCASVGTALEVRFANGQKLKIGLHPGHDTNAYEFAVAFHLFTLPRAGFVESLKAAGLDVAKLPMDLLNDSQ